MTKNGSATWHGNFKQGSGTISTETGALRDAPYGAKSRFENGKGTNPEELIGAAHAGCFTMAFSLMLEQAGFTADSIETQAAVTLEKLDSGFEITSSRLTMTAKIPGIDQAKFDEIANNAKVGCPVSKLLRTKITLEAKLGS